MEDNDIGNYITTVELGKIPKRKMNYRQYLYKQRIKYGRYCKMGIVNDKMKFQFKDGKLVYELDNNMSKEEHDKIMNDEFYKSLFYCSDLDFSVMPSKREIKLRKLLDEKINRLKELTKCNNNNIKKV